MTEQDTTAQWQGTDEEPTTTAQDTPPAPETAEETADEVEALKAELETAQAANRAMLWENTYRDSFATSGLPSTADPVVRDLLNGATPEQVAPTIAKLAEFAQTTQPTPVASQRPVDNMAPGTGRPSVTTATAWRDVISSHD